MTLEELQAKRNAILARLDVIRTTAGDRTTEFADAAKSLAILDQEIATATVSTTPRNKFIRVST